MTKLFRKIVLAITVLSSQIINAQVYETYLDVFHRIDTTRAEGDLLLRVTDMNFFKNDEYFSDYIEGYTLVGYKLQPSLVYYLKKNICFELGAQILQYGGTDRYDRVYPMASVLWQISDAWQTKMGMIDGHLAHRLHESMWDDERQLTDKPEIGLQLSAHKSCLDAEVWMNWQQFIKRGDTIPEKFTFGASLDFHPTNGRTRGWEIKMPIRLLVSHIGGQISDFSERMQSLANGSLSVVVSKYFGEQSRIYWDLNGQFFHAMVDGDVRPFSDGTALYPRMGCRWKYLDVNVGYWYAKNYFSLYGNYEYMSLSNYDSAVYCKRRKMLTMVADFLYKSQGVLSFALGAKGYYDTDASVLEYNYHIDLVITPQWRIGNFKMLR